MTAHPLTFDIAAGVTYHTSSHTHTQKGHDMDSFTLSLPGELLATVRRLSRTDSRLIEAITQMLEEPQLLEQYLSHPSRHHTLGKE
jgi:hypothetical protein